VSEAMYNTWLSHIQTSGTLHKISGIGNFRKKFGKNQKIHIVSVSEIGAHDGKPF